MEKKNNLDEIVAKYRPIVSFRVRKAIGFSNPDWEDVVHEIIINVIEKIKNHEFKGGCSIGTFIYTIATRRIADYIRKKNKVLKYYPKPNSFPEPSEEVEHKEKAALMAEAIKKLKPKYRKVLYLYYYKGFSRTEVAQKLGISPRRVSERADYAQKLLKKLITL